MLCILPMARAMQRSKRLVSSLNFKASSVTAGRNSGLDSSGKILSVPVKL